MVENYVANALTLVGFSLFVVACALAHQQNQPDPLTTRFVVACALAHEALPHI